MCMMTFRYGNSFDIRSSWLQVEGQAGLPLIGLADHHRRRVAAAHDPKVRRRVCDAAQRAGPLQPGARARESEQAVCMVVVVVVVVCGVWRACACACACACMRVHAHACACALPLSPCGGGDKGLTPQRESSHMLTFTCLHCPSRAICPSRAVGSGASRTRCTMTTAASNTRA